MLPSYYKGLALTLVIILAIVIVGLGYSQAVQKEVSVRAPQATHSLTDERGTDCTLCHTRSIQGATLTPHPERMRCKSCHRGVQIAPIY